MRLSLSLICYATAAVGACGGGTDDASPSSDGGAGQTGIRADASSSGGTPDGGGSGTGPDAGTASGPARGVCGEGGLCWELPYPQGRDLHAVWAAAPDDIWAVGAEGTVLRGDGDGWRGEPLPGTLPAGAALLAVHGSGPDDVWLVGEAGIVLHHDGSGFHVHDVSALVDGSAGAGTGTLYGVYAAAPDAVFAVGHTGVSAVIVRYDGTEWSLSPLDDATDRVLRAVWGFGSDDVWAVGDAGLVRHLTAVSWEAVHSPVTEDLTALHGLSADDLWVVGRAGKAMRWDGQRFIDTSEGLEGALHAVRVDRAPPVTPPDPSTVTDAGAAPSGPTRVWAFGEDGAVFGHDGTRFWPVPSGLSVDLDGAARLAAGSLLAVGRGGVVQAWQDGARRLQSFGSTRNRLSTWGDGEALWVVGDELLRLDASGWHAESSPTDRSLYGAWGDGTRVWAVGTAGTIALREDDAWHDATPASADGAWLRAVWTSGSAGFVVGNGGVALSLEGDTWVPVQTGTVEDLLDVWGATDDAVWAVGTGGKVLHWDGFAWVGVSRVSLGGVDTDLRAVWGTSETDVWVAGALGTLLHFDGDAWSDHSTGEGHSLNDVWGFGPDRVYAAGSGGTLLAYDGSGWSPIDTGVDTSFEALWGDASGTLFVAGLDGVVLSLAGAGR